jgi:hypothetical protein
MKTGNERARSGSARKRVGRRRQTGLTHGRSDSSLRVRTDVGGDHDKTKGETNGLTVDQPETDQSGPGVGLGVRQECHQTGTQNTRQATQIRSAIGARGFSRAVLAYQIKLPIVTMMSRLLLNLVATIPAINREMTWSDRPAQSKRAALRVLNPRPSANIVMRTPSYTLSTLERLTDDGAREVGEDSVGNGRTKHGKRQHPSLDVGKS